MSEQTRTGAPDGAVDEPLPPKSERRAAAKAAKVRAAQAKQRRQALLGALTGLVVVVLLVGMFLLFRGGGDDDGGTQSSASGAPSAPAAAAPTEPAGPPPNEQANPGFPPLPEGADPALGTKPDAGRGSGELTELKATPLIEGSGATAAAGQTITVNYVGVFYKSGEEFDASWKRAEPFSFRLGAGEVIPGWDQGLVGAKVGSRVQLDIPANLAYGENAEGGRPAGPLRFVVDVLALQ